MRATKYDYETVDKFWQNMRVTAENMAKRVQTNLIRWSAANDACKGVPAVTSAVTYLTNAKNVADTIVDAANTGYRLNEEYAEQLAEAATDINL